MDSNALSPPRPGGVAGKMQTAIARMGGLGADPGLRRAAPAIAVTLAAALGLFAYLLLAPPDRSTLATGLADQEKAAALDLLTAAGFAAELDPGSGALTVPASDYHRARMTLAAEGLPTGGQDGLSLLSDMPMGTSRSVEGARLRRMQELDLARSIAEIDQVESARVHLALPERSAFVRDAEPARASVILSLRRGAELGERQIGAIVSLVAAAVPNTPRDAVSVVDQAGRLLSTEDRDPLAAASDRQLRHRLELETVLRRRVEGLLTPILGPGNVAAEVTLDMRFTEQEITREEFDPERRAIRSEQENVDETTRQPVGGIPGAVSNTPPPEGELVDAPAARRGTGQSTTSTASTRNYEVSRTVETTRPQIATVERIHAAILVRAAPPAGRRGEEVGRDLAQIEALVKSAIGFDAARGDSITVSEAPFVETAPLAAAPAWYEAAWLPSLGRTLLQLGILAIVAHAVIRPLLTQLLAPSERDAGLGLMGDSIEVGPGETLDGVRARLDRLSARPEDLDGGLAYHDKVALLRELAATDTGRISAALNGMLDPRPEEARR